MKKQPTAEDLEKITRIAAEEGAKLQVRKLKEYEKIISERAKSDDTPERKE